MTDGTAVRDEAAGCRDGLWHDRARLHRTATMKRQSIALFLSSLACSPSADTGDPSGEATSKPLTQPGSPAPATPGEAQGGEG